MKDLLFSLGVIEMPELTVYQLRGFADRNDYLNALSEEYGIDRAIVSVLADMLGKSEDFDGLISAIKDV